MSQNSPEELIEKIRELVAEGKIEEAARLAYDYPTISHWLYETLYPHGPIEEFEWFGLNITLEDMNFQAAWRGITDPDERYNSMEQSFISEMQAHMSTLRSELGEDKSSALPSFGKRVRGTMRRHYYESYRNGRNKSGHTGLREEDLTSVRGILRGEYDYLKGFVKDLGDKWDKDGNIDGTDFRASLYGKSLRRAYNAGIVSELADDEVVTISEGAVATEHCGECPPRWGSYTGAEFRTMGDPVDWCEGSTRCRCGVIIERTE